MSFSRISLVQFVVFSVYWISAAILLWGQFKSSGNNIPWMSFSVVSLYVIVFFLIALLHHKFMKDERNAGWCHGDDGKHTNHSTAAIVNETLNEIQLQAATTATATTMTINSNKHRECEKQFYQKVGQQQELCTSTFSS